MQLKLPRLLPRLLIVTTYHLKVYFSIIRYEVSYYYAYAYAVSGSIDTGGTFLGSTTRAAFWYIAGRLFVFISNIQPVTLQH